MRLALLMAALLLVAFAAVLTTGCENHDQQQLRARSSFMADREAEAGGSGASDPTDSILATNPHDLPDTTGLFGAEITFCRKIGRKSGKRIGTAERFETAEKRYVHGLVDFRNVRSHRLYALHLVWIKPGGKELFRRYAEVVIEPVTDGYETVIRWKKAEDLAYLKEERRGSPQSAFTLASRLNISHSRQRIPGDYLLRVYLDRRLLLEKKFTLAEG